MYVETLPRWSRARAKASPSRTRIDGLEEVVGRVELPGLIRVLIERRHEDHNRFRAVRQSGDHAASVDVRHLPIEQQDIRLEFLHQPEGIGPCRRLSYHLHGREHLSIAARNRRAGRSSSATTTRRFRTGSMTDTDRLQHCLSRGSRGQPFPHQWSISAVSGEAARRRRQPFAKQARLDPAHVEILTGLSLTLYIPPGSGVTRT